MATASFPIPVLGNGQGEERDVTSEWRVGNFTFASGTEDVTIHFRVFHDDPDLKRLLDNGDARIMARWKCSSTISSGYLDLIRDTPHADGATYVSSLDQRTVLGPVVVSVFAVAVRPVPDFTFDPAKLYDPQNPPLNSIFKIVKSDQPRAKGISAKYFEDSQIIITLSKELFDQMQLIESANLKLTAIVLPVLVDAIDFIRANEGQGEGREFEVRGFN